jgi:hypothetical protein
MDDQRVELGAVVMAHSVDEQGSPFTRLHAPPMRSYMPTSEIKMLADSWRRASIIKFRPQVARNICFFVSKIFTFEGSKKIMN